MSGYSVLHITPHFGGGVGRVLSQVARYRATNMPECQQRFICLEAPEKTIYIDAMREAGVEVAIAPDDATRQQWIDQADIVQIEWWHHPLMVAFLAQQTLHARLVFWAHSSGLHYPRFPQTLLHAASAFLLTTAASLTCYDAPTLRVVPSSGGFDDVPYQMRTPHKDPLRFGYIGSLNRAKLHPDIMSYLQVINLPDFQLQTYGDLTANSPLNANDDCVSHQGFTAEPFRILQEMNVMIYLLNSEHYGTTENALLEAMAAGVVPIVMSNKVEASIVEHGRTGFVIENPQELNEAVHMLHKNRDQLCEMSATAATTIRERFSLEQTVTKLQSCYDEVMPYPKRDITMAETFGQTAGEWFESALGNLRSSLRDNPDACKTMAFLYEDQKSSPLHFANYFPDDPGLQQWCRLLKQENRCA